MNTLDKAFKIDREEKNLKKYLSTPYSKPKSKGGPDIGEEFAENAFEDDDESEVDEDMEETMERDEMLERGARNAVELPAKKVVEIPEVIAKVAEDACDTFRLAWRVGHSEIFDQKLEQVNAAIEKLNIAANQDIKSHVIPYRSILTLIPIIRAIVCKWAAARAESQPRKIYSRDVASLCGFVLGQLAKTGLSWKSIVTEEVAGVLGDVIKEGAVELGHDYAERIGTYIERDVLFASAYQASVALEAAGPLEKVFMLAEQQKLPLAKIELGHALAVNDRLRQCNKGVAFKEDDHLLPLQEIHNCLQDGSLVGLQQNEVEKTVHQQKLYLVAYLYQVGYGVLAQKVAGISASPEKIKAMLRSELQQKLDQQLKSHCIEFSHPLDEKLGPDPTGNASEAATESMDSSVNHSDPGLFVSEDDTEATSQTEEPRATKQSEEPDTASQSKGPEAANESDGPEAKQQAPDTEAS